MAHAHMESTAILVLTLSAIRSTNACPFTAFAVDIGYRILTMQISIFPIGLSTQKPIEYVL
jgi:hypothetical protein